MCPDVEILSSFYDDELEDSQRQIVKTHVDSCPHCQKKMAELGLISAAIHAEEEPDFQMAKVNTWNNIMDIIDREEQKATKVNFWQRRFQISFPAAAALVAAFIAVLSFSVITFYMGKHTTSSPASPELNMTDASDTLLNDDDNIFDSSAIEFDIPATISNFVHAGEPLLIKEVDFRSNNGKK
ncbi:MAG: zf-HC2 domain-containing protein [Spirochaetia bacterium]|nr:zf-HC2 domain-containing protein [Spirochaetia bacterium]MBR4437047.1 zf-HC2 domain-containing protein [Spirochaetales bacterium]MBR4796088.1 zf-HC2 domain-containing protein [Spirochaetia bacterium]MBR5016110.1 zf-HC2 domain-containing protein [Spirochaetia bacterium]MBR5916131.1 zf-HC2 domain-containing protein [Spirochaetia bacterium]